jgi:hypothetical protein
MQIEYYLLTKKGRMKTDIVKPVKITNLRLFIVFKNCKFKHQCFAQHLGGKALKTIGLLQIK